MAYYGNAPADVALVVGQDVITTTEIQDATIATADIASDAITATKIDDDGTGFQMGSLGLGTAVSGSHKLTVGGTATFSGDITGTLATASQGNITSLGTLTGLTVQGSNYTTLSIQAGTTSHGAILNLGDSGDIDYGSITQFGSGAGEGGRMRFKAGTTEVLNLYSNGNSTFAGAITQGSGTLTIKNASGDSNGLKIYQDSSDVARIYNHYNGELVFGVSNAEKLSINGNADVTIGTFDMTNPTTSYRQLNAGGFGVMHREAYDSYLMSNCYYNSSGEFIAKHSHSEGIAGLYFLGGVTSLYSYSGSVTAGTAYTLSERFRFHQSGTLQSGAGAVGATNAANWQSVVKSTTGGTIASGGGMGYFALGDNYTTSDAILMVRNDGNRGSFRHASGSSLIKAQFNDGTAFEVTKDGMIKGMQGAPARIAGNWEVVDVVSAKNNSYGHIQSDNCFNDNIYSQFKIIIPYINCDTQEQTLLFSLLYNSGSGLTEDTGDYYVSMDLSPHNTSSYQGGTQSAGTRAQIFGAMHSNTAVGVSGHIDVYEVSIADLRQYNQFSANTMRSGDGNMDNDRGSKYRPMMNCELMGYNEDHNAYTKQTTIVRANTERHASYWKGFRLQCGSGNIGAGSQVIVLGRAL